LHSVQYLVLAEMPSQEDIDQLNYGLDDLSLPATTRFSQASLASSAPSAACWATCQGLYHALRCYDSSLPFLAAETASVAEFYNALCDRGVWFDIENGDIMYLIISYLVSNVQAERLLAHRRAARSESQSTGVVSSCPGNSSGKLAFQLSEICRNLQVAPLGESNAEILSELGAHIAALCAGSGPVAPKIACPPKLLSPTDFSREEQRLITSISEDFKQDFRLRRQMLLRRLDVTMQSFLLGKQVLGREDELRRDIAARRVHLREEPAAYQLADAIAAPATLVLQYSQRSMIGTKSKVARQDVVKSVLIGAVPDRGGRVSQTKPKNISGFGNHRERSGGRGGGRGDSAAKGSDQPTGRGRGKKKG
jgi:hypothetical protein